MNILCKIGMTEYPPRELVTVGKSVTIILVARQGISLKCEFLYIVTCKTSTKITCEFL